MLKNERQPERVMRRLWVKFAEIYGHRWTSSYGEDAGAGAGQTWALGLAGLSPEQIASGILAAMRSGSEWPPSLPLFRRQCMGDVPGERECYAEAIAAGRSWSDHQWTHPVAYSAAAQAGAGALRGLSERDALERFRPCYRRAVEAFMAGRALPVPDPVARIAEPERQPAKPETAARELAAIASLLSAHDENDQDEGIEA